MYQLFSRLLIIAILCLQGYTPYSQTVSETDKTAMLCRIWGFLKYYHPVVAHSGYNWDQVFTAQYKAIEHINTKEELDKHFLYWINSLGDVSAFPTQATAYDTACNFNTSMAWQTDSALLPELAATLQNIVLHRATGKKLFVRPQPVNGAAEFTNEKPYRDMKDPEKDYRLLALARYWSMIEYFFPYKYKTDQQWDSVLTEMIPVFANASDTETYAHALTQLISKVNDSHANITNPDGVGVGFKLYRMPVKFKVFPDKAIITELLNEKIAAANDLRVGDVILSVNDTPVTDQIKYKGALIGASNEAVVRRNLAMILLNGKTKEITADIERDGVTTTRTIKRYTYEEINYIVPKKQVEPSYKRLTPIIGYVNMGSLKAKEVKKVLGSFSDMHAIIFDLRSYPNWTIYEICNYLAAEKTPFVKSISPDINYPGKYLCNDATTYGDKKEAPYKGKIIVLINEQTQSRAEWTTMALRALPNSICIGSQTAGADGNVSRITLPGNYQVWMTGLGVYYPDGRETQRIGIKPDVYVEPTVDGMRQNKDEVLERAIMIAEGSSN
ncbi:MAG: hypothetical protein K0Q79_1530 [Flavipsychrobacter sp.]|jgi:C-terminal processing protease CtpA/Prc|nr:hypothetical protein [Flavipsychrobacter sp.]